MRINACIDFIIKMKLITICSCVAVIIRYETYIVQSLNQNYAVKVILFRNKDKHS